MVALNAVQCGLELGLAIMGLLLMRLDSPMLCLLRYDSSTVQHLVILLGLDYHSGAPCIMLRHTFTHTFLYIRLQVRYDLLAVMDRNQVALLQQ